MPHRPSSVDRSPNDPEGAKPSAQASRSVYTPPAVIYSAAYAPRSEAAPAVQHALVASAQAKAASPPLTEVRLPERFAAANEIIDRFNKATDSGVNLGRRNFFWKLAPVALNAAVLAIAVAATAATSGLAIVVTGPLIALLSVNLAVSAGDAVCCRKNWQAAKDQANGGSRERLIGGDSCITHASMSLCRAIQRKVGGSEATADKVANGLSLAFKTGLGVATAFFTGGLANTATMAKTAFYVTKGVGIAINLVKVATRGIKERQFLGNVKRAGNAQDHYSESIPRGGKRMQRMNSIANDTLLLLKNDQNAFVSALSVGAPSDRHIYAAVKLQRYFERDADNVRNVASRGPGSFQTDVASARTFAQFTQGGTEDIGNAIASTGLSALAIGGLVTGELGWTEMMLDAVKDIL